MDDLDKRIHTAMARNQLAQLNDDTAIEEELAALYLCVSPKKLGELRANGGGPVFLKPQDPRAAGRNQPVSYVMGELRKWRESMSAGSNLEVARRQGLVGWGSGIEPFWTSNDGRLIGSALDIAAAGWEDNFAMAVVGDLGVEWLAPRDALAHRWKQPQAHRSLAEEYSLVLQQERQGAFAAVEATELAATIEGATI